MRRWGFRSSSIRDHDDLLVAAGRCRPCARYRGQREDRPGTSRRCCGSGNGRPRRRDDRGQTFPLGPEGVVGALLGQPQPDPLGRPDRYRPGAEGPGQVGQDTQRARHQPGPGQLRQRRRSMHPSRRQAASLLPEREGLVGRTRDRLRVRRELPGHDFGGRYGPCQFSESAREAYGGSASDFGYGSVAGQNPGFHTMRSRPGGESSLSPNDGCRSWLLSRTARTLDHARTCCSGALGPVPGS
jgi:hypothetical protein